jgi:hypothetical protein
MAFSSCELPFDAYEKINAVWAFLQSRVGLNALDLLLVPDFNETTNCNVP